MLIRQLAVARRKGRADTGEAPAQALSRQVCSDNVGSRGIGVSRGRRIGSPEELASWVHHIRDRFAIDTISNVHGVNPTAGGAAQSGSGCIGNPLRRPEAPLP